MIMIWLLVLLGIILMAGGWYLIGLLIAKIQRIMRKEIKEEMVE